MKKQAPCDIITKKPKDLSLKRKNLRFKNRPQNEKGVNYAKLDQRTKTSHRRKRK